MNKTTVTIKDEEDTTIIDLQQGDMVTIKVTKNGLIISQSGEGECNIAQGRGAVGKVVNTTTVTQQTIKGSGNVSSGSGNVFINKFSRK